MSTFQDTFINTTNLNEQLGSEVVGGEVRPLDHDDGVTLAFNGTSQDATAFGYFGVLGTSARSILFWIKFDGNPVSGSIISHWGGSGNGGRWLLAIESGVIWLRTIGEVAAWGSGLEDGRWHHIAITMPGNADTTDCSYYIDGNKVTPSTTTGTYTINIQSGSYVSWMARTGQPLTSTVNNHVPGSIDDARIYSRELSEDEIFSFIHAGIEPATTNLEGHWLFNEGSGSNVNDQSPNNRDLTLTGSPAWTTTDKPFYTTRSRSTSTELATSAGLITDFDFTVAKRSAGTLGRFQFSDDGSTWVNANGDSLTGYGAYDFDGVNDQINCGSGSSLDNIFAGGGTVMFWVFARSYGEGDLGRVLHKGDPGGNLNSTQVLFYVGGIGIYRDFNTTDGVWSTTDPFPLNRWVHVAITYNDLTTVTIYLDGVSVPVTTHTAPVGSAVTDAAYNLTIGSWNGATRWFDGYLSDIRIYKGDILSSTAIRDYYLDAIEPSETLDSHWKFFGNALDETDNNNDGSVSGAINTTNWYDLPAIGNYDLSESSVLNFDGTNDYAYAIDNDVFSFGNGASTDQPFSISAWVNFDAFNCYIVSKRNGSTTAEYEFGIGGVGIFYLELYDNNLSNYIGRGSSALPTSYYGKWHHYAATYDGSRSMSGIKLYIDGNQVDVTNRTAGTYAAMHNTSTPVYFGVYAPTATYSDAKLSNVAIWNDIRTQAEIISEVENGYVDVNNVNLVAYWPFDGNANEYFGNHNGTIVGATSATDYKRPPIVQPTQQNIDITGLSYTDFYYRYLTTSSQTELTTSLTEVTVTYLTEQNIVVKDSEGTTINDGEATPQDFGSTIEGESSPTLTFTIENTGESTLTISFINLPSGYSISGDTPATIAGSSSDTFTVALSTVTVGTYSGDIEVNSDDPDTATYNFAITGEIVGSSNESCNVCSITNGFLEDRCTSLQRLRFLRPNARNSLKTISC